MQINETEILTEFLARSDNYGVVDITHLHGHIYHMTMDGEDYTAVILSHSFAYYEKRYHLAPTHPTLVICHIHDTVLPVPVLSVRAGNFARAYELPEGISDMEAQRYT